MATMVLVIEDNKANLALMRYLLEAFGYMVMSAVDGQAGLELAATLLPDLVVCDIQLPKVDGYEVARQLKNNPQLASIPRVAVSAFAMAGDRERILSSAFDGYISKPIVPETFVGELESFLPKAKWIVDRPVQSNGETSAQVAPQSANRGRILIVDDVPANLSVLRSVLEPSGYEILTATCGPEAVRLAQQTAPDLVISDLHLPGEPDYALIQTLKSDPQLKSIPVVMMSATTHSEHKARTGLKMGAVRFLFRPIQPQTLLAEIEQCLSISRPWQEVTH
jgi:two-component system cell cycle response regulator